MTKTVMQCPTQDELTAFIRGDVPADRVEAIAQHLDSCEQCRSRWEQDPSENAFDDDLKWAERAGREVQVDVSVPLRQLREALPDYDIIREIGRGGMGIVYAARHLKLNRDVALKVLPALLGAVRDGAMDRFKREAELTARLKHTNIISVFDYGEVDGTYFYTMELVGGRTLREIIEEVSSTGAIDVVLGIADGSTFDEVLLPAAPLTPRPANQQSATFGSSARNDRKYFRQVATWIAEVAEAVEYAHSKGIIHRDIKPANLILARDRRLMIADFGLARSIESHGVTATHAVVGTARYMSPEQADPLFGKVSEATDVYGLGATLYELLTLRPMFEGKRDVDVVQAVLNKDPVPPRRLVKQVPRELETICLKAVEKRPAERYSSAQALADDLRRWLLDMPIEARRARWPARAYKFARRRKLAVSATAALVVLSVVSVFVAHQSSRWRANAVAAAAAAEAREIEAIQSAAQQDLDSGEFEAGLKRVELALHKHPNADALHISRASLLEGMGRRQEAVKELESYLDAHPNDAEAHLKLSTSYYNLRNKTMGDRHASLYLTLGGSSIASEQRYRIQARIETDPAKQIELFTKVLEINPADVGSVLVRSNLYGRVHRFDEMLADAKRAVAMRPNWALSFGYLGSAHYANKQDKEAEVAYGRAIELDPRNPEWWTGRAMARGNLGVYEGALLDATHAIELDPDSARAYSCRGSIKAYLGDPSGGLLDCARAIELEPNNRMHYHSRMLIYKLVGDWKKFGEDATR
ncbi:MAG: protein kinase, partial [Bdellovibrionales bacterium]|nr:protein kinase [Bdellovibrionales bacterium]